MENIWKLSPFTKKAREITKYTQLYVEASCVKVEGTDYLSSE
jgi:hypothetical protein